MKNAFTLAEVLITLVIIGVIAAMTIPTLMGNTNDQELKSKFKKAVSNLNQAIRLEYALYGKEPGGDPVETVNMLRNHLSVVEDMAPNQIKVADGTIYLTYVGDQMAILIKNHDINTEYNHSQKVFIPWREDGTSLLYDN